MKALFYTLLGFTLCGVLVGGDVRQVAGAGVLTILVATIKGVIKWYVIAQVSQEVTRDDNFFVKALNHYTHDHPGKAFSCPLCLASPKSVS